MKSLSTQNVPSEKCTKVFDNRLEAKARSESFLCLFRRLHSRKRETQTSSLTFTTERMGRWGDVEVPAEHEQREETNYIQLSFSFLFMITTKFLFRQPIFIQV